MNNYAEKTVARDILTLSHSTKFYKQKGTELGSVGVARVCADKKIIMTGKGKSMAPDIGVLYQ